MPFHPVDSRLLFSRNDPHDLRLGDLTQALPSLSQPSDLDSVFQSKNGKSRRVALAGYADDEGIRLNGGRPGAALAPDAVRRPLYKMTPSALSNAPDLHIFDLGNLDSGFGTLAERHQMASRFAFHALSDGCTWVSIGGGHDYGYPDAEAYIDWARSRGERPLILNFDAHLDVRPVVNGSLSSGTPFFRALEKDPEIDFAEIGLQAHCNAKAHLEWARAKGARFLFQEEVAASGRSFADQALELLSDWITRPRSVFLSIDIDGFSSAVAPGCSQSWATGFTPQEFFPLLTILRDRLTVSVLGLYEVSPPLDHDDRTAKLAAQIIHRVIAW